MGQLRALAPVRRHGGVDAHGKIVAADWTAYGQAGTTIDTTKELLGTATWPATPASGGPTPSDTGVYGATGYGPTYIYQRRVLAKTQPLYGGSSRRALRAPNAPQSYFASEQIVDELAHAAKMDPIAFRKLNIDPTSLLGARWLPVLDGATIAAGWQPKVAGSDLQTGNVVNGRGFGFGTFASSQAAIVADIQVTKYRQDPGQAHLRRPKQRDHDQPLTRRQPDERRRDPGLSRAMWESRVEQGPGHEPRLGHLPDPPLHEGPKVTLINVHPSQYVTVIPGDMTADVQGQHQRVQPGWILTGSGEPPQRRSARPSPTRSSTPQASASAHQ